MLIIIIILKIKLDQVVQIQVTVHHIVKELQNHQNQNVVIVHVQRVVTHQEVLKIIDHQKLVQKIEIDVDIKLKKVNQYHRIDIEKKYVLYQEKNQQADQVVHNHMPSQQMMLRHLIFM